MRRQRRAIARVTIAVVDWGWLAGEGGPIRLPRPLGVINTIAGDQ